MLSGCLGNSPVVPIYNKSIGAQTEPGFHIVGRGETLYSIAWRYGINYRRLAAANAIDNNYRIYPGQKLRIKGIDGSLGNQRERPKKVVKKTSGQRVNVAVAEPKKTSKKSKPMSPVSYESWLWPIKEKPSKAFAAASSSHKGIDIRAQLGDSVLAAKSGKVVYAGGGLRGYGNLIIVKHDETYLSAYGYNRRLLIKEGDTVRRGQKIAEAGASAGGEVRLHFEIRRNGKPLNPLSMLPK
nr:peptidoglycan DD-metalloendopeptidase family protein [Sinobacterium caligoides]